MEKIFIIVNNTEYEKVIGSFNFLRFCFSLLIFLHHKSGSGNLFLEALGPCGVSFFLILSGFVMTLGYGKKCNQASFQYKQYFLKRIIRFYPLHILSLVCCIIFDLITDQYKGSIITLLFNVLLLQSWIPLSSFYFSGNSVSWCLSNLMIYYLSFPFVMRYVLISTKRVVFFSISLFVIYSVSLPLIPDSLVHGLIYINPLYRFVDFFMGVFICYFFLQIKQKLQINKEIAFVFQILSVVMVVVTIFLFSKVPIRYGYQSIFLIPTAVLILCFAITDNWVFAKIIQGKVFSFVGEISFTFYMTHILVMRIINFILLENSIIISIIVKTVIQLVSILLISWLINKYFEQTVNRRLLSLLYPSSNSQKSFND